MPVYEWKRKVKGRWQYAITMAHDEPPEGKGWVRVYSLGISSVSGAGGSPARKVNTRASD